VVEWHGTIKQFWKKIEIIFNFEVKKMKPNTLSNHEGAIVHFPANMRQCSEGKQRKKI
jgi:hypothetical protein